VAQQIMSFPLSPGLPQMPLAMASPGTECEVRQLRGGGDFERRMLAMGLGPGRRLRVSQREGGQMVVIVGETRLALGRGIAQKILVAAVG
jgi:Fe2+ transport system protein FeoA